MRVLMVEADVNVFNQVQRSLRAIHAVVDHSATGADALGMARLYDYDIVLLDLALPDGDGCEVVRRMRASRLDTPVLVFSASDKPQAKVRAFTAGADDVLAKPFDASELQARIQAIVRRSKGYAQPTLHVGPVQLRLDTRDVAVHGQPLTLTGKEYAILELLMLRKGMVLTKEAFLNHLYGGMDEPEAKIIDVFVCKLRKKLTDAGASGLIGTVWGRGYTVRDQPAQAVASVARQLVPA